MKNKFNNENVYVVFPSIINEDKFLQDPIEISLAKRHTLDSYIDIFNDEELYYINNGEELLKDKKYINVFKNDCTQLSNYVFSLKTDHIKDLDAYMKLIRSIKSTYNDEELRTIISILKEEIKNIDYVKTKKTSKGKIRRKIKRIK